PVELEHVDLGSGKYHGEAFTQINPKGYVPVLQLEDGTLLTEGVVITQYLADKKPAAKLIPAAGTMERYRCMEWQLFLSTELHKGFSPLFNPASPEETREAAKQNLHKRFAYLDEHLAKGPYLMGDTFTVADAYLFTILNWPRVVKFDISAYKNLAAFHERVHARPAVQEALKAEGLK
ncbi:MAG: glutathione transferase GstA, partial [Proteobacteria bacterium]